MLFLHNASVSVLSPLDNEARASDTKAHPSDTRQDLSFFSCAAVITAAQNLDNKNPDRLSLSGFILYYDF